MISQLKRGQEQTFNGIENFITAVQQYRQTDIDYFYDKAAFLRGNGSLKTKEKSIGAICLSSLITEQSINRCKTRQRRYCLFATH